MLLQFSVENFRSFKNKAVLSMEASSDKGHPANLIRGKKKNTLKVASIFGANAAGKSNLFLALTVAIRTVKFSDIRPVGALIPEITPFAFDSACAGKPTAFEFVFIADSKKYVYGYSATIKKIYSEYLYVYNSARPSVIFERDADGTYKFTNYTFEKKLKPIVARNTDNKLFLATATAWNCEETRAPMLWLSNSINTYPVNYDIMLNTTGDMFENDRDNSLRQFTNNILKEADINISDYDFEGEDVPPEKMPLMLLPRPLGTIPPIHGRQYTITAHHQIKGENGRLSTYLLNMHFESKGTQNLFFIAPIIKRAFETGETMCVDEFDTSLHPALVVYLVGLFNNPDVNKKNAQLIISSHTMSLLDLNEMRRDQIYFVEKNQETGESELYSLDEFSPRTREDVRKAYLLGRYGSVPDIGTGDRL